VSTTKHPSDAEPVTTPDRPPEKDEDALIHVAKDFGATLIVLATALVVDAVKSKFELSPVILVTLNLMELSLVGFFLVVFLRTVGGGIREFSTLLTTIGRIGVFRVIRTFVSGLLPSREELTTGFSLGLQSGAFLAVFIGVAVVGASWPILTVLGVPIVLFVGAAIVSSVYADELNDSAGGAIVIVLVLLAFAVLVLPAAIGLALWLTGSADPVLDFVHDLLHRR
jgi:hypothetical protein